MTDRYFIRKLKMTDSKEKELVIFKSIAKDVQGIIDNLHVGDEHIESLHIASKIEPDVSMSNQITRKLTKAFGAYKVNWYWDGFHRGFFFYR